MQQSIAEYHAALDANDRAICEVLFKEIQQALPEAESKVWHAHPVWFINDNPIVGYSKLKAGLQLMFWSGADFDEPELRPGTGKFKDASALYQSSNDIDVQLLRRWLEKSKHIQWDYKNIVKNKGVLHRL